MGEFDGKLLAMMGATPQGPLLSPELLTVYMSEVVWGWRLQKTVLVTPAGIKQELPTYPKVPAYLRWSSKVVKGLVYIVTDKGPQQQRL